MNGTRRVNVITGRADVNVADVIRHLEKQQGRKFTVRELAERFEEFDRIADYVNSPPAYREDYQPEYEGPWHD